MTPIQSYQENNMGISIFSSDLLFEGPLFREQVVSEKHFVFGEGHVAFLCNILPPLKSPSDRSACQPPEQKSWSCDMNGF